uniref:RING-type E3 ubiquitin transferase n=1 Tax=Solanum tuberosum TaxID=4113 RepID=M1BSL0_SOLTU
MASIVGSKQAEQLKQDGNHYFQKNRFGAAIDAYTEAITLCPNVPIYWTNRALCHRKRKYVFLRSLFVRFDGMFVDVFAVL